MSLSNHPAIQNPKSKIQNAQTVSFADLDSWHDAIFLGVGLGQTNHLGIPGEDLEGVYDALHFIERIKTRGGNPFAEYSLPEAILKFKQGFGRLIRSKTDTGTVVVLDSRITTKSYGHQFIAALPKLPVKRVR